LPDSTWLTLDARVRSELAALCRLEGVAEPLASELGVLRGQLCDLHAIEWPGAHHQSCVPPSSSPNPKRDIPTL
jgi:hypothetical protein